jgi:hypothetical protein
MINLDYWSEYTQKEKHAIWILLYLSNMALRDDQSSFISRDSCQESMQRIKSIMRSLFQSKVDFEIVNMYPEYNPCDVVKYMSQSKKDKVFNCLINIRNDFDIMLIHGRINVKDMIIQLGNETNYNLNYDVFN